MFSRACAHSRAFAEPRDKRSRVPANAVVGASAESVSGRAVRVFEPRIVLRAHRETSIRSLGFKGVGEKIIKPARARPRPRVSHRSDKQTRIPSKIEQNLSKQHCRTRVAVRVDSGLADGGGKHPHNPVSVATTV